MAMAATAVVLSEDVPISQAGPEKAEVGSAEVARVESGSSDEEPSGAVDHYARPRGFKSARIGGAETIFQIAIPRSLPRQLPPTYCYRGMSILETICWRDLIFLRLLEAMNLWGQLQQSRKRFPRRR